MPVLDDRAMALLATAGTFDARGVWRELDAPPSRHVRAFVDALDQTEDR